MVVWRALTTVIFLIFFESYAFDWLRYKESMQLIAMANKSPIPPHPMKHPNPQVPLVWDQLHISPIAQPNPANIHVHTKKVERKEKSRKERRTLSDICNRKYKNKRKVWTPDKGNVGLIDDADQPNLRKRKHEPARRSGAGERSTARWQVENEGWRGHQRVIPPVGEPNGVREGLGDRCNQDMFLYSCHKSWLSKADFTWVIVISHKVCLCFYAMQSVDS